MEMNQFWLTVTPENALDVTNSHKYVGNYYFENALFTNKHSFHSNGRCNVISDDMVYYIGKE